MINKERLLSIRNLGLSDKLDKMDDNQFNDYCKDLDSFVEVIPSLETGLKRALEAKNAELFSKALLAVMDLLSKIHANDLAQSSFNILVEVRAENYGAAETSLASFLSAVCALSIDIQMAKHEGLRKYAAENAQMVEDNSQKIILAVDDASFLLNVLKASLLNTGYKFTGVTSGSAALKFLESHRPNMFILDIEMPEMDGYELAKRIRGCGHTAPIVFLTGNSSADYVIKAILAGAADFIVKPVNKEQVLEKIKKYIV